MNAHRKARGFTLVEALVTTAIISLVLTLVAVLFQFISQHYTKTTSDLDSERQARLAMANVTDVLRQAELSPELVQPTSPATPIPPVTVPVMPTGGPSPTATPIVTFTIAEQPTSANYAGGGGATPLPYDTVTISVGTPEPGHVYGDLQESVCANWTSTTTTCATPTISVLGHDISVFQVTPVFQNVYDIQITAAPMTNKGGTVLKPYELNSRVFLSYYKTNSNLP